MSQLNSHLHIFQHVAAGRLTSEEGAAWMTGERYREDYDRLNRKFDILMVLNTVAWIFFLWSK